MLLKAVEGLPNAKTQLRLIGALDTLLRLVLFKVSTFREATRVKCYF